MRGRRRGRRRFGGAWVMGGLGVLAAGAGLASWMGDARRRAALARSAGRALHGAEDFIEAGARDLGHRAAGAAHEAKARLTPERPDDDVLAERVRARLGHLTDHAHAIRVRVHDGEVELAGPVFGAERPAILAGVRMVRGVRRVRDRLEPHETADVRALQGAGPRRPRARGSLLPISSPGYRLAAGAAGAFLVGRALVGGGLLRIPAGLVGASLLGRVLGDAGDSRRADVREAAALAARRRPAPASGQRGAGGAPARPRRVPQVHEVKSPAELEPGIASARPDPLRHGRVARRGMPAAPPRSGGEADDTAGEGSEHDPVHVAPHEGFSAPPAGAGVREEDLGAALPHEDEER